ncbi:MAG: HAMP domain-containing histidine kinase [Gemmatimonadetes bacterium]|nr:HAMP domain-containing histidine kinase [Gemmatimonadota bacterium]
MESPHVDDSPAGGPDSAEFLAAIAHELRTPLSALRVALDLVRDPRTDAVHPEDDRRLWETIDRSLQRLEQHITEMLEIGYLRNNTLRLRKERIDAAGPIAAALDASRQYAVQRRVTIDLTLEDNLPELRADPGRLAQVLATLLTNAIKFSPLDSSVALEVSSSPSAGGEIATTAGNGGSNASPGGPQRLAHVVFSVRDRGPGIAEQHRKEVFQPFRHTPRRKAEAAVGGLSLAIAHALIALHGGRLWVESDGSEGAAFCFSIPVEEDDEGSGG